MRLPSVESLFTKILVTFKRFPLAIVAAVGGRCGLLPNGASRLY